MDYGKENQRSENRKILSLVSHGSILLGSSLIPIAIPIIILCTSQDSVVKANAKEALNFYISCYILAFIFSLLIVIVIGLPLLILLLIASWVMPIIAMIRILENSDTVYRYPLCLRIL